MPTEFNVTTGATLAAQNALNIPIIWEQGAIAAEYSGDVMSRFEGATRDSPITVRTLAAEAGATITFRTKTGLGADGVRGDELISNSPGPEEARLSAFQLKVDFLRHAAKSNKRANLVTAMNDEINRGFNLDLGDWVGRKKQADLLMMFRHRGNGENYASVNNKTREQLRRSDTISMSSIVTAGQILRTLGARPAHTTIDRRSGAKITGFNFFGLGEAWTNLRNSTTYRDAAANAQNRGDENTLFAGGLTKIDNNVLIEWNPEDHDMEAAIGSALNPKAYLGIPIAAGDTAIDITGGNNATSAAKTAHKYFEFFSNYQYRFGVDAGQTLAADTTDRYVIIYNTTGAAAGKWGFYRYRTNNGNKLTMHSAVSRLAASVSGVAHTTVGYVTWDAAKNTDGHPAGSVIIETNSYGVPFARTLVLGAMAACRGYSSLERLKRASEKTEGEFLTTVFISTIFGQAPFTRLDGRMPNFMVLESALEYAGLPNLPNPA